MRNALLVLTLVGFAAWGSVCSSGGGPTDAGVDGMDGQPPSDDGGDPVSDFDPSGSFLLVIPPGTSLCSGFAQGRTWQQELQMVGRVELRSGSYVLPRKVGTGASGALIERVLFGPDRKVWNPKLTEGTFDAAFTGGRPQKWEYNFVVPLLQDNLPAQGSLRIEVWSETGSWPGELRMDALDPSVMVSGEIRIGPGEDIATEVQRFALCNLPDVVTRITAMTAGGDQVDLEIRRGPYYASCFAVGETVCLFLTRAEATIGSQKKVVEDRFGLIYVADHHNWFEKFLVRLDPPAGEVAALLVIGPGFNGPPDPAFVYLDAGLNELRQEPVTSWQPVSP